MGTATYHIAVIGSGMIANQSHIPALKLLESRIGRVTVCGRNERTVQQTAERYGISGICTDRTDFLGREKPDLIIITTPNASHTSWIRAGLEAGCHVVCEKPLCISGREAVELYALAEKKGLLLVCCQNMRFRPDFMAAKACLESGTLGDVYYAQFDRIRRRGIPGWGSFCSREANLGGAMADIGVHLLDSLLWMLGNPQVESVLGTANNRIAREVPGTAPCKAELFDVEDFSAGMLRTKEGISISFKAAWAANQPEETAIRILGTQGGLELPGGKVYQDCGDTLLEGQPLGEYDALPYAGHYYLLRNVLDVLDGRDHLVVKPEETINVCKTLELFYRSAEENREVKGSELW